MPCLVKSPVECFEKKLKEVSARTLLLVAFKLRTKPSGSAWAVLQPCPAWPCTLPIQMLTLIHRLISWCDFRPSSSVWTCLAISELCLTWLLPPTLLCSPQLGVVWSCPCLWGLFLSTLLSKASHSPSIADHCHINIILSSWEFFLLHLWHIYSCSRISITGV